MPRGRSQVNQDAAAPRKERYIARHIGHFGTRTASSAPAAASPSGRRAREEELAVILVPPTEPVHRLAALVASLGDEVEVLLDPHPGEGAALDAERVTQAGELVLLGEELLAGCQPFVLRSCDVHRRLLVGP